MIKVMQRNCLRTHASRFLARVLLLERVTRNSSLRTDCPSHHLMTWGDVRVASAPQHDTGRKHGKLKKQTYLIVVEMENAKAIDEDEVGVSFTALAREIIERVRAGRPIHQTRAYYRSQRTEDRYAASPDRIGELSASSDGLGSPVFRLYRRARHQRSQEKGAGLATRPMLVILPIPTHAECGRAVGAPQTAGSLSKTTAVSGYT